VVHGPKKQLGIDVSLLGGEAIPLRRLGIVLRNALARVVHEAKAELGHGIISSGRVQVAQHKLRAVVSP
jgi:hypothetical protein